MRIVVTGGGGLVGRAVIARLRARGDAVVAAGIVAALDRGRTGESYRLSGPALSLREATTIAARIGGHPLARLALPDGLLRIMAPLGRFMGQPNLREIVDSSSGVTYLASSAKAERELGFRPRDIETGLREVLGAARTAAAH